MTHETAAYTAAKIARLEDDKHWLRVDVDFWFDKAEHQRKQLVTITKEVELLRASRDRWKRKYQSEHDQARDEATQARQDADGCKP